MSAERIAAAEVGEALIEIRDAARAAIAAKEEERLALQDELRGAQLEIERLQRYADAVTAHNSELMRQRATDQRMLEKLAADMALGVEVSTGLFRAVCQARDAGRPSTRLYVPHSVARNEGPALSSEAQSLITGGATI